MRKPEERATIRSISMPDNKWREIEEKSRKIGLTLSTFVKEATDNYFKDKGIKTHVA